MKKKMIIVFTLVSALSFASEQSTLVARAAGGFGNAVPASFGHIVLPEVDWEKTNEKLDEALQGQADPCVNMRAGYSVEFTSEALQKIAGQDVTLALHTGDGLVFSVNGMEVGETDRDIDISVSLVSSIPSSVKGSVLNDVVEYREFKMEEREEYPCPVSMHVAFAEEYAGKLAILYYYENTSGVMKAAGFFRINDLGRSVFRVSRGDEYLVTVADSYVVQAGDSLSYIASRSGVTVKALMAANPQIENADEIRVGDALYIPV